MDDWAGDLVWWAWMVAAGFFAGWMLGLLA